jgi:hypothetical protein
VNKSSITALALIILALIGAGLLFKYNASSEAPISSNDVVSNEVDTAIRARVSEFGAKLKNVSLLQPKVQLENQMAAEYGPYLTPELLQTWQENTETALGRTVSSPWPDRIVIEHVEKIDENFYQVEGRVIEVTSSNGLMEPAAIYPVTLTLELRGNAWLIAGAEKGDYIETPEKVSVIGRWIEFQ